MAFIHLPSRWLRYPAVPVEIGAGPYAPVAGFLFNNAKELRNLATRFDNAPVSGNPSVRVVNAQRALRFDGTGDYIDTGVTAYGGASLSAETGHAWSVVVSYAAGGGGVNASGTIIARAQNATTANRRLQIFLDSSAVEQSPTIVLRGTSNATDWRLGGLNTNEGGQHQVTVTWDGSNANGYGDGDRSASLSVGTATETPNISFGARSVATTPAFLLTGNICYCYFYDFPIPEGLARELWLHPYHQLTKLRSRIYVSAPASGAIAGSANLVFSNTGTLLGAGALAGAANLAFTNTGTLLGAGALAGSSALAFTNTGTLLGTGALAGASNLAFTNTGTLTGGAAGDIAGTVALSFTNTGTLTGAGALAGQSALGFSLSGTLTPPAVEATASGGWPILRRKLRRRKVPEKASIVVRRIAEEQTELLSLDEQQRLEHASRELVLAGLEASSAYLAAIAALRSRLIEQEIGTRLLALARADDEAAALLLL